MQVVLENEALKVTINSFGAELASIREKATDTEYLWNADAKFWKRTAPVLDLSKPIDLNIHAEDGADEVLEVLKPYLV